MEFELRTRQSAPVVAPVDVSLVQYQSCCLLELPSYRATGTGIRTETETETERSTRTRTDTATEISTRTGTGSSGQHGRGEERRAGQ